MPLFTATRILLIYVAAYLVCCDSRSSYKNLEAEIYAELNTSISSPPLEKECFFDTGSWKPDCDPSLVSGLDGFFATLDNAIKMVERFKPHAKQAGLEVTLDLEGLADGQPWTHYGQHAAWMDAVFTKLATRYGYPNKPTDLNMKLACTRMLVLYDFIFPYIEEYREEIQKLGTLNIKQSCTEVPDTGWQYRVARLKAKLNITVPKGDYELMRESVRETGFTIIEQKASPQ